MNTWNFSVRVLDSGGHSANAKRSITIARRMAASVLCPTAKPCQVEAGCVIVCGKFGSLTGGVGPYIYSLSAGSIPTGMGRNGLSLTGNFPAPSARAGNVTWLFTVTVADSLGVSIQIPADFLVFPHIAWSVKSGTCGPSYGCTVTMGYSGGTPGGSPKLSIGKVVCGNPPCTGTAPEPAINTLPPAPCFTYNVDPVKFAVTMTFGLPGNCGDWVGSFVANLMDQNNCAPGPAYCSASVTVLADSESRFG